LAFGKSNNYKLIFCDHKWDMEAGMQFLNIFCRMKKQNPIKPSGNRVMVFKIPGNMLV